ncbi:response regulator [Heliobacterium gestii]|uniref:Stage 0 sporulation protein A homolog n=1 Tax=Heliomicrobium gestii TaxID=2699 RepID=A0A845L5J7_HELGE|nr:response regulator transcription factor [Heliomicrobium gestii]MBM7865632.1 DNA-binding response OmpR family regulator [Heliomicrobium gestii]MZP41882.1 response regulator [Heliomicrobium gestii]
MDKILVADDDKDVVDRIAEYLQEEGFGVSKVFDGMDALKKIQREAFDLVILNVALPTVDGVEICRQIRSATKGPIILVSEKNKEIEKVLGFELGADDYVTKPFGVFEFVARVKAHLRRESRHYGASGNGQDGSHLFQKGDLVININAYEVLVEQKPVVMTTKEFQILQYLMKNKKIVLTREQIYSAVWGDHFSDFNTVTVHIKSIRKKLGNYGSLIKTIWGVGYQFLG